MTMYKFNSLVSLMYTNTCTSARQYLLSDHSIQHGYVHQRNTKRAAQLELKLETRYAVHCGVSVSE